MLEPAPLILEYLHLFTHGPLPGPVLDLACGKGQNGIVLARHGVSVICCDRSSENLEEARRLATVNGALIETWQVDLELPGENPLPENFYGGILVFRYLHRPLIPCIRKALCEGGLLLYETYTVDQPRFGKPRNPDFLLKHGELKGWFEDYELIHYFEGIEPERQRAIARIVCRKPEKQG